MLSGFEQLRTWLPEMVVDALNPHATVTTEVARELIGNAVSTTLIAVGVLFAASLIGGLRNVLLRRALYRKAGRFLAFVRNVCSLAVIAAPWWAVWQMIDGDVPGDGVEIIVVLGALGWILACVVDHSCVWLDQDGATIELRRGFAVFPIRRVAVHLDRALLDPKRRSPLGKMVTERHEGRRVRSVMLAPEAWQPMVEQLGRVEAIRFLQTALTHYHLDLDVDALPAAA